MTQLGDRITVNGVEYVTVASFNELQCKNDTQAKHLHEAHQTIIRLYGETASLTRRMFEKAEKVRSLLAAIEKHQEETLANCKAFSTWPSLPDQTLWEVLIADKKED